MNPRLKKSLLTFAIGVAIWYAPAPAGVTQQAWHLLAIFIVTIAGFILSPLPIGAIAFSSIAVSVILGVLKPADALLGFADPTVLSPMACMML